MKLEQSTKVENLKKTYKGNIQTLDGLSFEAKVRVYTLV